MTGRGVRSDFGRRLVSASRLRGLGYGLGVR